MRSFAALIFALSTALAQQGAVLDGPKISGGDNTVANPNFNSGMQSDTSLVSVKGGTGDQLSNVADSTFANFNINGAIKDAIVNNPSFDSVSGNQGWSANGKGNSVGSSGNNDVFAPFLRRSGDAIIADNHYNAPRPYQQATHPLPPQTARPLQGVYHRIGNHRSAADIVQIVSRPPPHGVRHRRRDAI
ncbi:hypothetical protein COEREDRAFT_95270 [Coemansia reversa NRRL 1564]|uniref:Uncharacterized protein n=1 Tax=Coemansia reversa (strain ATCC 12441 / NRRL 1564) TaxID=763665 RepID=A0A2G5BJA1_COERN|nr:hypothetical protein COEREDRAFT_95270 [Coemansia reversa NRRL 1564]|eukprot:PIA19083.1 hypothetical protein COEREDRAFT_95270 [Coemansia reversa NRRL 1564]